MISLPNVTIVIADCMHYGKAINAIQKTLLEITPARVIFFTDITLEVPGVEIVPIDHFYSKKAYSDWMMKELGKQDIQTSHILIIQHDGYVLDGSAWDDAYLNWDYIGAPWLETDGMNVGNGGFSLRSMKLHRALATDDLIIGIQPEDTGICRIYRDYLEQKHGIKFCPDELAHKFSYELHEPKDKTFGFHGPPFHPPYKEPIVIRRTAALGDVIQTEPLLEYFHLRGHPVYLDTNPGYYQLFGRHFYPVRDFAKFDKEVIKHRLINLDLAYEVTPQQLHLKSYFEMAGVTDYVLRNPKLNYQVVNENRLFKKYVVVHIDERDTPYRNVYDVDWRRVAVHLEDQGYTVIQVGKGVHENCGLFINTVTDVMALWLVAGASLFIGIDSGISHMAVATGVKSVIMFGSVNPAFIHADMSRIFVIQNACPIQNDGCWHSAPGTTGVECAVEGKQDKPPCCVFSTFQIIDTINKSLDS